MNRPENPNAPVTAWKSAVGILLHLCRRVADEDGQRLSIHGIVFCSSGVPFMLAIEYFCV
jgi:hypothetical protein